MNFNKITVLLMALAISACQQKNAEQITEDTTMDTTTTTLERPTTIAGPAGSLHIEDGGASGMPILFLHGFGGSTTQWKDQLEYFKGQHRVIAFDFRGHGQSDLPSDSSYAIESIAQDLEAVVDKLGVDKFVLVGHSMGGSIATAYTTKHPDRVAGLVLVSTPGKTPKEQSQPIIASLKTEKYQKVMDDYMKMLLTNSTPEVNSSVTKDFKAISREASINIITETFAFDPTPGFKSYAGPKLIIASERESKQPNSLRDAEKDVPYKVVDKTGHWIQMDKPDEFNKILEEFLNTVDKTRTEK
jgi:pimeloyl-ACP methyl ester carboxylesterase